jgi:hypothetical protein
MLKKIVSLALIIIAIYWSFSILMPSQISSIDADDNSFSTQRALVHLKEITKKPHYIGSPEHEVVKNYIIKELEKLGLETQVQEGPILTDWGTFTQPKNILARIKGTDNSKALMLLSHYDSKSHASYGASDAGSGVVTILEGLRAFLNDNKKPKNDIIILISDAEELGLNGASLFVNHHPWAKDVGLVLNFEARGSGGPSYMLLETNGGNHNLIKGFITANPEFPVANSLAYSIYKKLPNDTDLTRFREDGDIEGFNFAFIDDHFDYHTALDNYDRLDRNSLEHQLTNLKSETDDIYFNVPLFKTVSYPFSWIFPMLSIAFLIFCALVFYGISKRTLKTTEIRKGFVSLFGALLINGVIGFFAWKVLLFIYPQYGEMLHGFTYNGHAYIWAFSLLSIAICLWIYHKFYKPENTASLLVAPLLLWLLISAFVAFELKGASFFIIPVLFGLVSLFVLVRQKKPSLIVMAFLVLPALMILSPFVKMFPIGLGLKFLGASTLLSTLIFSLAIGVFGFFRRKNRWSYGLFFIALCFFIVAHLNSGFSEEHPKPNSLVYILDADDNSAMWATNDHILDDWTKDYLTDSPDRPVTLNKDTLSSKYNSAFTYTKKANIKPLKKPYIDKQLDTIINHIRHVKLFISPQRLVHQLSFSADTKTHFLSFNVNGYEFPKDKDSLVYANRKRKKLFSFHVADDNHLEMSFTVPATQKTKIILYETSYDMLDNKLFRVPKRPSHMIPKPFVVNDAVIIKKTITLE